MSVLWNIIVFSYCLLALAAIVAELKDNNQPSKTVSWLFVIIVIPVIGILLWYFFGQNIRRQWIVNRRQLKKLARLETIKYFEQTNITVPKPYDNLVKFFTSENRAMPFFNNEVTAHLDGYGFFLALLEAIGRAKHHIHIISFIFDDDPLGKLIRDALIDKARQGVSIRIIYDDMGSWKTKDRFFEVMRKESIEVQPFLPVHFPILTSKANYRNHKKLIVIDGKEGFIGGMNIALRYIKGIDESGIWRDTQLQLRGNIVYAMQRIFLIDWHFVTQSAISDASYYPKMDSSLTDANLLAQVVTSGPNKETPEIEYGYLKIINSASKYIYIETPYFIPPENMMKALIVAVESGVDVRIMTSLHSDSKIIDWVSYSYLREMHEHNIKVYLYQEGFLHSKMLICDDELVSCGSANFDFRSFEKNFEANVFMYGETITNTFKHIFNSDLKKCLPANKVTQLTHPTMIVRLRNSIIRLVSPLL